MVTKEGFFLERGQNFRILVFHLITFEMIQIFEKEEQF